MQDLVEKARTILKYFKQRHMPLPIFWSYEKEHSLLMPVETRFASNFIAIHHLLKVKRNLHQSIMDPQWKEHMKKLWNTNKK